MHFPGFYGNEALKRRLRAAGQSLSHCYILAGPAGSGKKTLADILAAAMECEGTEHVPCGVCGPCQKVKKREHPDVITVDSDKATVPISLIRDMQADAYVRPNEGRRKVYILPRAGDMQPPAQNALLKLLEEPPSYCAFLLLTESEDRLLETVRSRAVTLTLSPLSRTELASALGERRPEATQEAVARAIDLSDGYLGAALTLLDAPETELEEKANALAEALASGDELLLLQALLPLEKLSRQDFLTLLTAFDRTLLRAMEPNGLRTAAASRLAEACSGQQLFHAAQAVGDTVTLLQANGSAGHAVGNLMAQLHTI